MTSQTVLSTTESAHFVALARTGIAALAPLALVWMAAACTGRGEPAQGGPTREVIRVEGGTFMMGSNDAENAQPVHSVHVPTFEMTRAEITVGEYRECVVAGACLPPPEVEPAPTAVGAACNYHLADRGDHPVDCVTWDDAHAFARWRGEGWRLPTSSEWEFAASNRGAFQHYPWGGEHDSVNCANSGFRYLKHAPAEACVRDSVPVCRREEGTSPLGFCDLAGNAAEWMEDDFFHAYDCDWLTERDCSNVETPDCRDVRVEACPPGTRAPDDGAAWVKRPTRNDYRDARGGSFLDTILELDLRRPYAMRATDRTRAQGFRLARTVSP